MESTDMNSRMSTLTIDLDRLSDFRKSETSLLSAANDDSSFQPNE
ncbi:unnamed protein product, partial [Rotaria socialis]